MKKIHTAFFLFVTYCILTHSKLSIYYAFTGLELWYSKMIPSLFPFMLLSGLMVRMKLTESFATILYPLFYPIFRMSKNACYTMFLGFFCGFPMGAKTIQELQNKNRLKTREAEFLMAFTNNIGPAYFVGFALPLLHRKRVLPYLFGMYGIPLLYGIFLRYTFFRDLNSENAPGTCSRNEDASRGFLWELDDAVHSSVESILSLGGYMILFQLWNLLPNIITGKRQVLLAPLFEITGGIQQLGDSLPLYSLLALAFGGFCCIAQTYSCIKKTSLSLSSYVLHKCIITLLTAVYYFLWYLLFPATFLQ